LARDEAHAVRLSRMLKAELAGAEYLRQLNRMVEYQTNPLEAVRSLVNGRRGMKKYFRKPWNRKRLADFLAAPRAASFCVPLMAKTQNPEIQSFVISRPGTPPFLVAIYGSPEPGEFKDRDDKVWATYSLVENEKAFNLLIPDAVRNEPARFWDAVERVAYDKQRLWNEVLRDGLGVGVPRYPGVQVIVPDIPEAPEGGLRRRGPLLTLPTSGIALAILEHLMFPRMFAQRAQRISPTPQERFLNYLERHPVEEPSDWPALRRWWWEHRDRLRLELALPEWSMQDVGLTLLNVRNPFGLPLSDIANRGRLLDLVMNRSVELERLLAEALGRIPSDVVAGNGVTLSSRLESELRRGPLATTSLARDPGRFNLLISELVAAPFAQKRLQARPITPRPPLVIRRIQPTPRAPRPAELYSDPLARQLLDELRFSVRRLQQDHLLGKGQFVLDSILETLILYQDMHSLTPEAGRMIREPEGTLLQTLFTVLESGHYPQKALDQLDLVRRTRTLLERVIAGIQQPASAGLEAELRDIERILNEQPVLSPAPQETDSAGAGWIHGVMRRLLRLVRPDRRGFRVTPGWIDEQNFARHDSLAGDWTKPHERRYSPASRAARRQRSLLSAA
jgi:hypothetical protein